ncbi:protein RRNAD1-like [Manduca sexta]|uniref:protein RRNAD1-like n=1 Tax=Manduca sexta TaxID=7130 RepID=UPI00188F3AF1|nr:protein RRNAD1-like [Manduca sexta]
MSLPSNIYNPEDFFNKCVEFFNDYQFLYNFPNTDILVKNVLEQIHVENLQDIDVFQEDFDIKNIKDTFIKDFFDEIQNIQPNYNEVEEDQCLEGVMSVPVSAKKKHEIVYLAREIKYSCKQIDCNVVVDFGSGLGYLDQLLYEITNFKVLGLECNEGHYAGAKKRQRKYHENSIHNVKYIKHRVTEQSDWNIKQFLNDKFGDSNMFCITGLHACADLTIDAINIFLKMEEAKALILMPCCYHRMNENSGKFHNFPLSNCLKNVFAKYEDLDCLNVPFLRLAAQPPNRSHKMANSVFNLLARAVLQLYAYKHSCRLKRNKRKAVNVKSMDNNFESYIQDACTQGFTLIPNTPCVENDEQPDFNFAELLAIWRQMSVMIFKKAAILIHLQNLLQPIFENFVLYDRITYLKENGVVNCTIRKIFDVNMSPRCLALIAYK